MMRRKQQRCPLFPEKICPGGAKAGNSCKVRINGDFDPVARFRDLLLMYCAISIGRQQKERRTKAH